MRLVHFLFDGKSIDMYNIDELINGYILKGDFDIKILPETFKTVIITEGEEIVGSEFDGLVTLEEVSLPDTIKRIGYASFRGCENMKKINIPKSTNYIGDQAFNMCQKAEFGDIEFPDSIECIGARAFEFCNGITSLHIPASIKKIGANAFKGCENLKNFRLDGTPEIVSGLVDISANYAYGIIGKCPIIENIEAVSESYTFIDSKGEKKEISLEQALFCSSPDSSESKDMYDNPRDNIYIPKSAKILVVDNISEVPGDVNCDGNMDMSDAVLIMQSLANPAKYGVNGTDEHRITDQGKKNADIAGDGDGVTNLDALAIQKKLLKLE